MDKKQFKEDINRLIDVSSSFYDVEDMINCYLNMLSIKNKIERKIKETEEVDNTFRTESNKSESEFGGFQGGEFGGGGASGNW